MDVRLLANNTHTKNLHKELLLGKDEKEEVISINVTLNSIQPKNAISKQHRNTKSFLFQFSIGRSEGADCCILDINISRKHAYLKFDKENNTWNITDNKVWIKILLYLVYTNAKLVKKNIQHSQLLYTFRALTVFL